METNPLCLSKAAHVLENGSLDFFLTAFLRDPAEVFEHKADVA